MGGALKRAPTRVVAPHWRYGLAETPLATMVAVVDDGDGDGTNGPSLVHLGFLEISGSAAALQRALEAVQGGAGTERCDAAVAHVFEQLDAYLRGERRDFTLRLRPSGTPFQQEVWAALCEIPYGETISYAELARRVGVAGGARAVGGANGRNPIPIVIPCHRVIAADGTVGGYSAGLERKRALLALERGERRAIATPLHASALS